MLSDVRVFSDFNMLHMCVVGMSHWISHTMRRRRHKAWQTQAWFKKTLFTRERALLSSVNRLVWCSHWWIPLTSTPNHSKICLKWKPLQMCENLFNQRTQMPGLLLHKLFSDDNCRADDEWNETIQCQKTRKWQEEEKVFLLTKQQQQRWK